MARRSRPALPLQSFFHQHLHDDLRRVISHVEATCWKRGIEPEPVLQKMAGVLNHHVNAVAGVQASEGRRAAESRRDQRLRRTVEGVLNRVLRRHEGYHSVEDHVRAILADFRQIRPGPRKWIAPRVLKSLGVSRRDVAWLIAHATKPQR
jgi:hypothetical protein